MENKLQATIDIGSHSCILLIAAFEDVPVEIATSTETAQSVNVSENSEQTAEAIEKPAVPATRKTLVPKLQKVEVCRLGEDI